MDEILKAKIKNFEIQFKTRPGVFSKSGLDNGSRQLIDEVDFERVPERGMIADLGCGAGVIGFASSKIMGRAHVHLLDVNLRFVELAKENATLNELPNVEVFLSDQFSAVEERSYHLILSNPAQHLGNAFLEESAKQCLSHLKPDGEVYWVVQDHLAGFVERLFAKIFKTSKIMRRGSDYAVVRGGN